MQATRRYPQDNFLNNFFLFIKYFAINLVFRLYILVFPYRDIRRFIGKTTTVDGAVAPRSTVRWVGHHVFSVARFVPGSTCLTRAMAAQYILKKQGFASTMRIGVAEDRDGKVGFLAHAWLVSGDEVVVGNEAGEVERFKLLTEMGAHAS